MNLNQLLFLYLLIGLSIAVAFFLTLPQRGRQWAFQLVTAALFWPLYLPILLTSSAREQERKRAGEAPDELSRVIAQADAELQGALQNLDGWAEEVLAREKERLQELRQAWTVQADRIREMDCLLSRPEYFDAETVSPVRGGPSNAERILASQQIIRKNLMRLRQVRQRTLDDLLGNLAWVRELASMIHLAKYTGAPASRAEELVAQIATAIEGVSALAVPLDDLAETS